MIRPMRLLLWVITAAASCAAEADDGVTSLRAVVVEVSHARPPASTMSAGSVILPVPPIHLLKSEVQKYFVLQTSVSPNRRRPKLVAKRRVTVEVAAAFFLAAQWPPPPRDVHNRRD